MRLRYRNNFLFSRNWWLSYWFLSWMYIGHWLIRRHLITFGFVNKFSQTGVLIVNRVVFFLIELFKHIQIFVFFLKLIQLALRCIKIRLKETNIVFFGTVICQFKSHSFYFGFKWLCFFNIIFELGLKLRKILLAKIKVIFDRVVWAVY